MPYRGPVDGVRGPQEVPMQWVPWPCPSCGGSPATNDCVVTLRPAESGWGGAKPVSRTATRTPLPERGDDGACTACMPHVACAVSANVGCDGSAATMAAPE